MESIRNRKPKWRSRLVLIAVLPMIALAVLAQTVFFAPAAQNQAIAAPTAAHEVALIVGKADKSADAEMLVAALGGKVTKDLHIINAFGAIVPVDRLPDLKASESVAWVSFDGPVQSNAYWTYGSAAKNYYLDTLKVSSLPSWCDGSGVGIAVIDSGIDQDNDFVTWGTNRLVTQVAFGNLAGVADLYGHGTHVAGIIAGDGSDSGGYYSGIAPGARLHSLKIADGEGNATESDVVAAMQWVYDNHDKYNIRVVNLSVNSGAEASYNVSPLDAAAEILWFNNIVVVTSAGNKGPAGGYNTVNAAPANDPFVITVGATDEKGDGYRFNDVIAPYSALGTTKDGYSKPDIVAPGTGIYSVLSQSSGWGRLYPERTSYGGQYFRLSGTSMAAPMVAGIAALILENEPGLTADQVKYRLRATSSAIGNNRYVNAYAAVTTKTYSSSNTGLPVSNLLTTGDNPVFFPSVIWNSVMWNSVMWNSVMWNSVQWNSTFWK